MYRAVTHRCPQCRAVLDQSPQWERCATCGGIWVAPRIFFETLRKALPERQIGELMVHNDGSPRRPCPQCELLMDIAWLDFLPLEQCGDHGIWLDPGEFEIAMSGEFSPRKLPKELVPDPLRPKGWGGVLGG